jgi:hypothetical protein
MCIPTRYPPLSSLRSVPRLIVRAIPLPTSGCLTPPLAPARPYSNIPHSPPFRLRTRAARAFIRSRPSPPPPASASACGTRPIRRQPHTRPLCPSFKHCVCRAAIGEGRGRGGVWNPLSTLGLLNAREKLQRREEEGAEYLRQVSGRYGTASTGVRGWCRGRGRCGAGRRVGGVQGGVRVWCVARFWVARELRET